MKVYFSLFLAAALHTADAVDCSKATPWQASNYPGSSLVHSQDHLWTNSWATSVYQKPGADGAWKDLGVCDAGTAGNGPALDCSQALVWKASTYDGERKYQVVYNDALYTNKYWAGESDVPGVSPAWEKLGSCQAGSVNEKGPQVSCEGVTGWSASTVYGSPNLSVHYKGALYKSKWWTSGTIPSLEKDWTKVGACIAGSDSTAAPSDPLALTPEKEQLLCTCIDGCGQNSILGPLSVAAASEAECPYIWCPKYNNRNETACAEVKAEGILQFYSGELVEGKAEWPTQVYVPYVDGGLASLPKLSELARDINVKHFVIAFITTGGYTVTPRCVGAFAGVIPVGQGPTSWNQTKQNNDYLYEEVNKLRLMGGDITVSFGGANGIELADSSICQSGDPVANLKKAYKEVVEALKLTHIDFDIEGNAAAAVNREKGWKYRFEAVKQLSTELPNLKVWWTLPTLPTGLTQDGVSFITELLASGARFDKLNVMTMDYGDETICPGTGMGQCEQDAIDNVAKQVFSAATAAGQTSKYGWTQWTDVYPQLGSTPMLGLNDVTIEKYTLADAANAAKIWKTTKKIGIVSNWSLARDAPCSYNYVSVDCSSLNLQSEKYEFAKIFAGVTTA